MNKLCECGCGKEVKINRDTKLPNRFIMNHWPHRGHHKHTDEQKAALSKRSAGNTFSTGLKRSSDTKKKISLSMTGKIFSNNHIQKLSLSHQGHVASEEAKKKMSASMRGKNTKKGFKHTEETKHKISMSTKKRIQEQSENLGTLYPREGLNERYIIETIYNALNRKEFLLRNNQTIYKKCKRFPDNYDIEYNIVVDVLEEHHFDKITKELINYDHIRQADIAKNLCCMIYYISEKEFLNNPENEIQRFKNFLELLRIQRN